jgi:hypothetical protein
MLPAIAFTRSYRLSTGANPRPGGSTMAWISLRRGRALALLFAGALLGASVGVATGAIPTTESGIFYACYDSGGGVKLIDYEKTQTCPKGHSGPVFWSQTGPQGIQGIQGIQGAPGTSGGAVYFAQGTNTFWTSPASTAYKTVVSKDIPAGAYVAEVYGDVFSTPSVTCRLPGLEVDVFSWDTPPDPTGQPGGRAPLVMTAAFNHAGGPVLLECKMTQNTSAAVRNVSFLAREVASVD